MNYIVDTHILLWHADGQNKLSNQVIDLLNDSPTNIYVSHATFWEMTIKKSLGKLEFVTSISDFYQTALENFFLPLNFDIASYEVLETLPFFHQDPFDRMIIAQAIAGNFTIITQDRKFEYYENLVPITWN